MSYTIIPLKELIEEIGEEATEAILSNFTCPSNTDVEYFLRKKAILFSRQGLSMTHLIFASYNNKNSLIAYFTLAPKTISLDGEKLSNKMRTRIKRFSPRKNNTYTIPSILIAQIGKNFTDELDKLIVGDDLMGLALDTVHLAQSIIGGKITFLECEDVKKLKSFYERNGFILAGKRLLDGDETDIRESYLLQYIRWL